MKNKHYIPAIIALLSLFSFVACKDQMKNEKASSIAAGLTSVVPDQPGPEILPDGRVTFQLMAPKADEVSISGDFWLVQNQVRQLEKDNQGLWSLTTESLSPGYYSYWYTVDGISMPDPGNGAIKPGLLTTQSTFVFPGSGREWETIQNVPHGDVRMVWYYSTSLEKIRRMHVYLPPGYDNSLDRYPVLYLLHGGRDTDDAWVSIGRVNMIMDNLLAQGKAKPMIIVMPFTFVLPRGAANFSENTGLFSKDLFQDVIPYTENTYRTLTGSENRGLGGLSYSGILSDIAMANLDKFNYLCYTSSGLTDDLIASYDSLYPGVIDNPDNVKRIKILVGNGINAMNFSGSRNLVERMKQRGYHAVFFEHNGVHGWPEFREDFYDIVKELYNLDAQ